MNILVPLQIGLREISSHKFRSFLSMLGIVLGVSSLIATLALTTGIERGTREFMQQMGGLEYVSVVNKEISNAKFEFWNLSPGRTLRDAQVIRESAPLVSHISPELSLAVGISSGTHSDRGTVRGVTPDHFVVSRHELAAGRFLTDIDVERGLRSAVIGSDVASLLWPELPVDAIPGQILQLNNRPFEVVGVFPKYQREEDKRRQGSGKPVSRMGRRWDPFRSKNESILIPYSTMFYDFRAGAFPLDSLESARLDTLTLRIANLDNFRAALDQVRRALELTHRGVDDFDLETREEWFDRMESSIRATRLSGGLIATISLVVGGIGIMNIMLATVTERTREIGMRLAIGARRADIRLQFLVESVALTVVGGVIGLVIGVGASALLSRLTDYRAAVQVDSAVIAFVISAVIGVIFGLLPAERAARLTPSMALRHE